MRQDGECDHRQSDGRAVMTGTRHSIRAIGPVSVDTRSDAVRHQRKLWARPARPMATKPWLTFAMADFAVSIGIGALFLVAALLFMACGS